MITLTSVSLFYKILMTEILLGNINAYQKLINSTIAAIFMKLNPETGRTQTKENLHLGPPLSKQLYISIENKYSREKGS